MCAVHPRLLKTFLAVARTSNMTRASEQIHLAQSSVSDQIQALATELGTSLFMRGKAGLKLTPAGEALKTYAEDILNLVDEARTAVDAAAGKARLALAIGALETIASAVLPRWLARFRDDHPAIDVRLSVGGSGDLARQLDSGDLDVAFCFDRGAADTRFVRRVLAKEPLVLIGPPGSPAGPERGGDLASLATFRFIATESGCVYRRLFEQAFADAGVVTPKLAAEVGSIRAIARLVAAGTGLALVPRLAVDDVVDRGDVVELPWPGPARSASLIATWRRRRVQPPALKLLLSAVAASAVISAGAHPRREAPSPW
jgi:DNA-binding transcriptional LysR family regulator